MSEPKKLWHVTVRKLMSVDVFVEAVEDASNVTIYNSAILVAQDLDDWPEVEFEAQANYEINNENASDFERGCPVDNSDECDSIDEWLLRHAPESPR